ncbi:DUF4224 domain-containing protein [Massilia dura]|uniref:DUF4224 domain-containing protein n=1 Tax=Pseudoduganella dura TaxID=321982 RepID=A0A6I3XH92_9BURK|nr:DUF4224 domain-containing protein [Pseudoduganella dura]MUI13930.1 DUF4224 domain-containing protein [Pseudoduganella dura]GGX99025.1 hypothetical protein GCM10007386_32440 [Pseudoduganella dura]
MDTFLTPEALERLTGWRRKSKQIEQLRRMGLPFWINGIGAPVVTIAAVEGRKEAPRENTWVMPRRNDGKKKHS